MLESSVKDDDSACNVGSGDWRSDDMVARTKRCAVNVCSSKVAFVVVANAQR